MLVRCTHCGYQNNEHYRFCGSCGAILQVPPPEPASAPVRASTVPPPSAPVAKPTETPRNLDYLLEEDEPAPGHKRMYAALVLLLIAGIVVAWQWYAGEYAWSRPSADNASATQTADIPQAPAPTLPSAPAPKETVTPSPEPKAAAPESSQPPAPQSPTQQAATPPADTSGLAEDAAEPSDAGKTPMPAQPPAEAPSVATAPTPKKSEPTPKASVAATPPAPVAGNSEDKLVEVGEKYLYGNGVPENCAVAQKNLRAAAQRSSSKAQSILGTMYATGHCVDRDLPMAYRWYAKALHQDPGNDRIQTDLEVLWRQMSAEDRQLAIKP